MAFPPENERGAALLTVLLLVAVMAVIAATALDRLQLSTRLAANSAAMTQARFYGYGAEALAMSRIGDLLAREPEQTTLTGNWLDRKIPFPVGQGLATAQIKDASNCFNLNSLVNETVTANGARTRFANPNAIKQFSVLMQLLQLPQNEAEAVAESAADWMDTDQRALPGGAEDGYYRGLPIPQLPPNQLMADRSELLSVKGVTPAIYGRIREWICALPVSGPTQINVNTLSPDRSILLAMLFDGKLSIGEAKALLARRPLDGYGSLVRFWNAPLLAALKPPEAIQEQVQLKSKFFQLQVEIMSDGIEMESHSLINASGPQPFVVSRSWGEAG